MLKYINANLYLAATYARFGQPGDAAWEVEKILVLGPEISLAYWAKTQLYSSKVSLQNAWWMNCARPV